MNLDPSVATVNYQWQYANDMAGTYTDITGANQATYTIAPEYASNYIRLYAIGIDLYNEGIAISNSTRLIKLTDEADILNVLGEIDNTPEGGNGTTTSAAITWEIRVDNEVDEVNLADVVVTTSAAVHMFSNNEFNADQDEPIELSLGENKAYIKVVSEYESKTQYYAVNIIRELPDGVIPIANATELKNIENSVLNVFGQGTVHEGEFIGGYDQHYMMVNDINLGTFEPIGYASYYSDTAFSGYFDGNGHVLYDGVIIYPSDFVVGVFAHNTGTIINLGVVNVNVQAQEILGGIVGRNYGTITKCYTTGRVDGWTGTGGIVGQNYGNVSLCYSTAYIESTGYYSVGGGLVGINHQSGTIIDCYATGDIYGYGEVGGFVGRNQGTIIRGYSIGDVHGVMYYGGFSGKNEYSTYSYQSCYWNTETSDQPSSAGAEGRTTVQMKIGTPGTKLNDLGEVDDAGDLMYEGWSETIWDFGSNEEYPSLKWD